MSSKIRYSWTCPHCGLKQSAWAEIEGNTGYIPKQIVCCDVDEGGCDQWSATKVALKVTVTVYKLVAVAPDGEEREATNGD